MKKVLLLLLILSSSVFAFDVSIFPREQVIRDGVAEFDVDINNDLLREQSFDVFSTDVVWNLQSAEPLVVSAKDSFSTKLFVRPLNINPGLYSVVLNFRMSGTSDVVKQVVLIEIPSNESSDDKYLPAVRAQVKTSDFVPRDGMKFSVLLENQNKRDLSKVEIKVRSNVVNKDYATTLAPMEKKSLSFDGDVDLRTVPQSDVLRVSIIVPDGDGAFQFDVLPVSFNVLPSESVSEDVVVSESFLKSDNSVVLTNSGNVPSTYRFVMPMFFLKKWFVSSDVDSVSESGRLVWNVPLNVGESRSFLIVVSYRPLFWLLILSVVLFVAYLFFRSPLVVVKRARVMSTREGGISEMKIFVEVTNRSGRPVRHVVVMDLVPSMAEHVHEKSHMLVPSEVVRRDDKGTLLKWRLDVVESKEQRILVYSVRSKFSIIGGVKLPVAVAKFSVDGREREVASSAPEIKFAT